MPRWDNSARKGMDAQIFHGSTPQLFERWLRRAASIVAQRDTGAPLIFVNSWNEWAEGAHLEPDERTGRQYLEAVQRVVSAGISTDAVQARAAASLRQGLESADGPVAAIVPGSPDLGDAPGSAAAGGFGWIESVDGAPLDGYVVIARRDDVLRMTGWFYGDPRHSGRRTDHAYLILSAEGSSWHAPIEQRQRRADLQRAMLVRDRRTRRLVRSIDRLPTAIGRRILRLWAGRNDHFGFDIRVRLGSIPAGYYHFGFVDSAASGACLISTAFVLKVT
jgi:hypothetical protein